MTDPRGLIGGYAAFDSGLLANLPDPSTHGGAFFYFATDDHGGTLYISNGSSAWVGLARGRTQQPMSHTAMHSPGGSSDLSGTYVVGAHSSQSEVDFGFASGGEGDVARVTVAASWVDADTLIACVPAAAATADHDPEDAVLEQIQAYATNIVPGASFDIEAVAPEGSWGRYLITAIAV